MSNTEKKIDWEIMDEEIRIIVEREAKKSPRKMDMDLIYDGLDYLHPFDAQEDILRTEAAWADFQNRYMPQYAQHRNAVRRVRSVLVAAVLMALMLGMGLCYAFGIDIWSIAVQWTKEYLQINIVPNGEIDTEISDQFGYNNDVRETWGDELCDTLEANHIFVSLPAHMEMRLVLEQCKTYDGGELELGVATSYVTEDGEFLHVSIRAIEDPDMLTASEIAYEADETLQEIYETSAGRYYIMYNMDRTSVAWCRNGANVLITGNLTIQDVYDMIAAIEA